VIKQLNLLTGILPWHNLTHVREKLFPARELAKAFGIHDNEALLFHQDPSAANMRELSQMSGS